MAYYRKRGEKWSFTVDIGTDADGKRRQKTVSGFASKKDAEKACAELITNIERGEWSDNKDTVEGFLKHFFENQIKMNVSERTYYNQLRIAEQHIYPTIGKIHLIKLTPLHIQKLYNDKLSEGLSSGYVATMGIILGKAMRTAHQWGLVTKNVTLSVKKPTQKMNRPMNVWTQEEVNKFLVATKDSRFHVAYVIALTTGMRIGEILALTWSCVDFTNSSISVQYTTTYTNKKLYMKEPKTLQSRRLINLPKFAVTYLKQYKLQQEPNALGLVVPNYQGELLVNSRLQKVFVEDTIKAGVPRIRFHDMRHTHATLLLQMGEPAKVVQERLGHSTIVTTLNTYTHVLPTMQRQVANKLDDVFEV